MLEGKDVDYIPRTPILMQFAAEFIGADYAEFASCYKTLVKANEECAIFFGIDQLSCISDPYRETHGFGGVVSFVKDGPPRSTHPLSDNPDTNLLLTPDPLKSERMHDRVQAVELYKKRFGDQYSILGWVEGPAASAATLRNMNNFLLDLVLDETYAGKLMDKCLETGIDFAEAQIHAGADTIGIGDAIASQVSPEIYEDLILPRERKLIQAVKNKGAYVKLHICGNITHLLPGISTLNIDIIDVDHMVNLSDVRASLPRKVVITGNIDPVEGLLFGTPGKIQNRIIEDYRLVGSPYMVNAGCEVPSGVPIENLKALCGHFGASS